MDAMSSSSVSLVLVVLAGLVCASQAYDFSVGGRDGWVLNPSQSFNNWAESKRFQVNDKLVFKYKKGENSVLVVKKEDYDSCNTTSPINKLDGGNSVFQLDRSGPFFFISGAAGNCEKGQKLVIIVLAIRNKKAPPPSSPASPPISAVPSASPSPFGSPLSAQAPAPLLAPSSQAHQGSPPPAGSSGGIGFNGPAPAPSKSDSSPVIYVSIRLLMALAIAAGSSIIF